MALSIASVADLALIFLIFLVLGEPLLPVGGAAVVLVPLLRLLFFFCLQDADVSMSLPFSITSVNFATRVVSDLERCLDRLGMFDSVSSVGKDAALLLVDFLGLVLVGDDDDDDDDAIVVGNVDNGSILVGNCEASLVVVLTGRLDLRGLRFFSITKLWSNEASSSVVMSKTSTCSESSSSPE